MRRFTTLSSAALILALAVAGARAADRDLGAVQVTDTAGASVAAREINPSGNWVLLLLDAGKPAARDVVQRLKQADVDWNHQLVIVTQGSAPATQALRTLGQPLKRVRWYSAQNADAAKGWGLGGTPAILAVQGNGRITNSAVGFMETADRNLAMMRKWTGVAP